jgi:hypothetical protein
MPTMAAILAGSVALAAVSAEAAPLVPAKGAEAGPNVAPPIELVRDGCGYGYYRTHWQDGWGNWHWGRCVPKWWGKGAFLPPG